MIRVSKITDYGFVLMSRIAGLEPGRRVSAREMARLTGVPLPVSGKILKSLARRNLLISHRGAKGGYSLARPAARITAEDIITALDGPLALMDCMTHASPGCELECGCRTRPHWERINDVIGRALRGVTLAEMAGPQPDSPDSARTQPDRSGHGIQASAGGAIEDSLR